MHADPTLIFLVSSMAALIYKSYLILVIYLQIDLLYIISFSISIVGFLPALPDKNIIIHIFNKVQKIIQCQKL